ncbi:Multidrug/Oligosaccharidyl-lipid/Polysaccharide (MOP) Flippase Superfamily [Achlya hypogyna]|uniref:Multidrug/Oligosaccharidyl-lipid/Polysaccharide (MOP) Flippase Superfamily n=1 Tax=Achlya hypogyna TaxID=1202772 RepID=A0A1V9ZB14_ACHHY|nr:Multidrug/Oligosaccharidyl-lipid/Polysaccharide (MOP) Flippase Superfamily [Achlya hypogyna]
MVKLLEARASIELYDGDDGEFNPLLSPAPISKDELAHVLGLAIPLVVIQFLEYLPNTVNGMLMGHLATEHTETRVYLAAGGLSNLYYTVFAYGLVLGVCTAMDALCAQAYGKGMKEDIGFVLQTALVCAIGAFGPVVLLLAFSSVALQWMGQAPEIAAVVQTLTRWMIWELPASFLYEILKRVLQGQNIVLPIVVAILIGNVVNVAASYLLMYHTSLGYTGWALAFALTFGSAAAALVPAVRKLEHIHFGDKWQSAEIYHRLPYFISLSLNGWGMFVFEFFAIALTSFLAGDLPHANVAMSANNIFMGFRSLFSMVYLGIGTAASIRVGNALGGNLPCRAKIAAWQTVGIATVWALVTMTAMFVLGPYYTASYTTDPMINNVSRDLFWTTAPFQVSIGIWATVQGVFRGSGKPDKGVWVNFGCFFLVAVPLGHVLAASCGFGIVGLWLGVSVGFTLCAIYGLVWLYKVDWNDLVLEVDAKLHA